MDPASIAFAALAEEYRKAGRYVEAIATCQAGLQRHPAYLSARVTLGRSLLEMGQYDEAREQLEQVIRVAPENLAAIRGLAELHHRRGEPPETLEHYDAAADAAPPDDAAAPDAAAPTDAAAAPSPEPAPAPTRVPLRVATSSSAASDAATGAGEESSPAPPAPFRTVSVNLPAPGERAEPPPALDIADDIASIFETAIAPPDAVPTPLPAVTSPAPPSASAASPLPPVVATAAAARRPAALDALESFLGAILRAKEQRSEDASVRR
jgi:tetratricopeptide (TPR) repeat protein